MPPKLSGIDHVHIYVSDRPAAHHWYQEVLGFA
ncbi:MULTISPECIES: VOC family protein [Microbulbifer]|nr:MULTISPECIES: VOC family protein [Microbulbifer]